MISAVGISVLTAVTEERTLDTDERILALLSDLIEDRLNDNRRSPRERRPLLPLRSPLGACPSSGLLDRSSREDDPETCIYCESVNIERRSNCYLLFSCPPLSLFAANHPSFAGSPHSCCTFQDPGKLHPNDETFVIHLRPGIVDFRLHLTNSIAHELPGRCPPPPLSFASLTG